MCRKIKPIDVGLMCMKMITWVSPTERQRTAFLRPKVDLEEIRRIVLEKTRQGVASRKIENRLVECIACSDFELGGSTGGNRESSRYDFVK